MRLIKDTFFIKADKDLNKYLSLKGFEGKPLVIDTDLEKFTHSCKIGVLSHVPLEIDQQFSGGCVLKKGDTILFHHHVVQDCNKVSIDEQDLYRAEFFQIFAKVENDRIVPVENFIFVDPILEPEENLWHGMFAMKPHREFLKTCAKVCFVGTVAADYGIVENDVVYFTKNADYEINVAGKLYWRMRVRNIMAIERNGELVCFRDKMIVKPIPFKEQMFSIVDDKRRDYFGEVIAVGTQVAGINVGDKINYCHGVATKLNYNGQELSFLALSNINYVI